jgi:hypothetical protein
MHIHEAPHGINLVIETPEIVYIGRFDNTDGFQVFMHDCAIHEVESEDAAAGFIKQTAKFGIPVDERDVKFDAVNVKRVRILGEITKD